MATPFRPEQAGQEIVYIDKQGLFWKEVSGKPPDPEQVIKARMEKMTYEREHDVYVNVPI